jgi:hypothetical protein
MLDFNISPYYDDFDADKNFHKVLFKPGVSVQARELTQLQSILQDQILKFGNHIFKHGSVVIPGNSGSDLNANYVKLENLSPSELAQLENIEGVEITGQTTGITALIRKTVATDGIDPTTLYVQYKSQGTEGQSVFDDGEVLTIAGFFNVTAVSQGATGLGSLAYVNDGVYYVNGMFVTVHRQFVPIEKYSKKPSKHILLKITEEIIDSDIDETLLDPAQGSFNFSAPGADRHRIILTLTTLPLGANIESDYFELMRYNNGILEEHSRYPKYNELEKSLARRTYDESGDYVVAGLELGVNEHLKSGLNNGIYIEEEGGDRNKFVAVISPGKAYIRGFENEKLARTLLTIDKGRTSDHIKSQSNIGFVPQFGQYIYISDLSVLPVFSSRETVRVVGLDGKVLGTCKVLSISLHVQASLAERNIFKLYVYDVETRGVPLYDAVRVVKTTGAKIGDISHKLSLNSTGTDDFLPGDTLTIRSAPLGTTVNFSRLSGSLYYTKTGVVTPKPADIVASGATKTGVVNALESIANMKDNTAVINTPFDSTYRIRKSDGTVDATYSVYKNVTVNLANGAGSASITGATLTSFNQADPIAVHATEGYLNLTSDNVEVTSTTITLKNLTGVPNGEVLVTLVANKNNQTNKAKTIITHVENRVAESRMVLQKCDVYNIVSVIEVSSGLDFKAAYTLDSGQRDFVYQNGELVLSGTSPVGNLVITYQYFQHSGNGDYFSVDSYETSGLGTNYYDRIPEYRSKTDGRIYKLKDSLDFRTRINLLDPTDSSLSDLVVLDSRVTTSIQYYVPRVDLVIMDKSGIISSIKGIPSENPVVPAVPSETLLLGSIDIPAYTPRLRDIKIVRAKNQGYTMAEISQIEDRIFRLEQYSLLNQSEQSLINTEIIDAATGLSRFKSGYLVETFDNPDMISDIFNLEFSATYVNGILFPKTERNEVNFTGSPGVVSNVNVTPNYISLPFTEVVFAQQNVSSRITNVNPFAVYTWVGVMELTPSSDSWVETEFLPKIFNETVTNQTQTVEVQRAWDWQPTPGAEVRLSPAPVAVAATPGGGGGGGETCFTPESLVETVENKKIRIDQIKVGDLVWNWNKTRLNEVKFVEKLNGEFTVFTPSDSVRPFATHNHPLYIDGVLSTIDPECNYHKWLGDIKLIHPAQTDQYTGEVYNLWVGGDHTFVVNGYGTTSIVDDGGWMSRMFEKNILKYDEVLDLVNCICVDNHTQYGAYLVNTKIRDLNIDALNILIAKILRKDCVFRKMALNIFSIIGKLN